MSKTTEQLLYNNRFSFWGERKFYIHFNSLSKLKQSFLPFIPSYSFIPSLLASFLYFFLHSFLPSFTFRPRKLKASPAKYKLSSFVLIKWIYINNSLAGAHFEHVKDSSIVRSRSYGLFARRSASSGVLKIRGRCRCCPLQATTYWPNSLASQRR